MIFQILIIAWLGVRSRLGRSILTALSLFIGVLAIVVIQAGAGAAQDAVMSNAILTGGRAMTLSLNVSNGRRAFGQADQLLSHLNNVLALSLIHISKGCGIKCNVKRTVPLTPGRPRLRLKVAKL